MTGTPSIEELDRLTTDELRQRAFDRAERHADVRFFWDLITHLPSAADLHSEDGSLGGFSGGITEAIELVRELFGKDLGELEPLVRARFIDYLREHPDD